MRPTGRAKITRYNRMAVVPLATATVPIDRTKHLPSGPLTPTQASVLAHIRAATLPMYAADIGKDLRMATRATSDALGHLRLRELVLCERPAGSTVNAWVAKS